MHSELKMQGGLNKRGASIADEDEAYIVRLTKIKFRNLLLCVGLMAWVRNE